MDDHGMNSTDAYLDWNYRVVSSAIWIPLSIMGILGNLMVILVVMTVRGMKTPTNCYLVSLASADCLFCLSTIPSEMSSLHLPDNVFVFGGRIGCSILRFLPFLSINASSLSITAFTVERYIGICHPMKARYICTVKRAQLIIVGIWIFSILYNSTWLFLTDLKPLNYIDWPDAYQCTFSLNRENYKAIFLIDMFIFYWIPLLLYLILYGIMARTLVKAGVSDIQSETDDHRASTMSVVGKRSSARVSTGTNGPKTIKFSNASSISARGLSPRGSFTGSQIMTHTSGKYLDDIDAFRASASFNVSCQLLPNDRSGFNGRRRRSTPESPAHYFPKSLNANSSLLGTPQPPSPDFTLGVHRNTHDSNCVSLRASPRGSKASCGDTLNRCRAQVVKMLIVIVATFALFCLPYRGLVVYNSFTSRPWLEKWYLLFSKVMVMANSAINPLLYNLMSARFRDAFIVTLTHCYKMRKRSSFRSRQDGYNSVAYRSSMRGEIRSLTQRQWSIRRRYTERCPPGSTDTAGRRKKGMPYYGYNRTDVKDKRALVVPIVALTTDIAFKNGQKI